MQLLNLLRRHIFWFLDFTKGSPIKKHYREIKFILDNPLSQKAIDTKKHLLDNVLRHAANTTPFYKTHKEFTSINDFPIIKKNIIQENFDGFKSEPYLNKKKYKVATSGSTGIPFFLFKDENKKQRNTADTIIFSERGGYTIGDRLYELEVWRAHNKKSTLRSWLQNVVQFDITRLTETRIKLFLEKLKSAGQKTTILGFASSLETICQFIDKTDYPLKNIKISSVIANSEFLNRYTKDTLSLHLKAPVLSRYSSEEIGIVAQQTIDSQENFIINHASYYIELLNLEKDTPAKTDEFGRIVITDLFNYCMPIIRYDTGDIAKMILDKNGNPQFENIEGRRMDLIYDCKGNIISSFVVYTKFYKYYHLLKQYQFIQESAKEYTVKLNVYDDTFPFEKELIEDIKSDFGNEAVITIQYVDEIPTLASGKRKKVVNNYKK